jgi:hypothetical protein
MLLQKDPGIRTWDSFDVSSVAQSTQAPLKYVTVVAFQELQLFRVYAISCRKLLHFLDVMESLYPRCDAVFLLVVIYDALAIIQESPGVGTVLHTLALTSSC